MTVVVDPGSGAACQTTPAILQALGCRVITINGIMDGTFPGRLPEPSAEGLKELGALVVASNAVFGVAHDGDADRAVFIDEKGSFVEENQEFALIAQHSLQERERHHCYTRQHVPSGRNDSGNGRMYYSLYASGKYLCRPYHAGTY